MVSRLMLALLPALALMWSQAPAAARAPEATRLETTLADVRPALDWYGIYVNGAKNGWMRIETRITGKGASATVVNKLEMELKTLSLGHHGTTRKLATLEFDGRPPYRLLRARGEDTDDDVRQVVLVTRRQAGYQAEIATGKSKQRRELGKLDYTLADWLSADVWVRRKPGIGQSITVRELDLERIELDANTYTLIGSKQTRVRGVDLQVHELDSYNHKTKIKALLRVDRQARLMFMSVASLFEVRLETEAEAKNTTVSVDLFALGSAKLERALGPAGGIRSVTLKVHGRDLGQWIKSSPSQKVEPGADGTLIVKLGGGVGPELGATKEEIADGLAESVAYPISNARVQALAREAVGDARTDQEKLTRIVAFVNRHIRPSLNSAAPRLLDLLDRRSGDCKSFAMLVVALARASGLPAREVSGLVYMGDDDRAFGGHAWAEVAVGGLWIGVDATMPVVGLTTSHIRYGAGEDGTATLIAIMGSGGLRLDVVEIEPRR